MCVTAIARSILAAIVVHAVQYKWVVTYVVSAAILAQQRRQFLRQGATRTIGGNPRRKNMRDGDAGDRKRRE